MLPPLPPPLNTTLLHEQAPVKRWHLGPNTLFFLGPTIYISKFYYALFIQDRIREVAPDLRLALVRR